MYVCVVSTQILSSTTLFNINNKIHFEVLKDYVTLKTGVMAAGNSALHHRDELYFKIYSNRKQSF